MLRAFRARRAMRAFARRCFVASGGDGVLVRYPYHTLAGRRCCHGSGETGKEKKLKLFKEGQDQAVRGVGGAKKNLADGTVVRRRVMLSHVVGMVFRTGPPVDEKLSLADPVANPVETHVDRL